MHKAKSSQPLYAGGGNDRMIREIPVETITAAGCRKNKPGENAVGLLVYNEYISLHHHQHGAASNEQIAVNNKVSDCAEKPQFVRASAA